jgi:hypothetical protein
MIIVRRNLAARLPKATQALGPTFPFKAALARATK